MLRPARLAVAALLFATAALSAQPGAPAAATAATAAAAEAAPLSPQHRLWLTRVAALITPHEREAFLALRRDYQRDSFIRRFWQVRDPYPQTARNELQEAWEERAKSVEERNLDFGEDRARILLLNGEPAEVFKGRCSQIMPLEFWSYPGTEHIKSGFTVAFASLNGNPAGPFRLWGPSQGVLMLLAIDSRIRLQQGGNLDEIADACPQGGDITARLAEAVDWPQIEKEAGLVPQPGEEWVQGFLAFSTDLPEGAAPLPAELEITYPSRFGSRTVLQGLLSVPREQAGRERIEGAATASYSFLVDGEILRNDELFEHFRYRFVLPEGEVRGDRIPVIFQRFLRPGRYGLILRVEDTAGKRFFRDSRDLEVPPVEAVAAPAIAPPVASAVAGGPGAPAAAGTQPPLAEANAALGSDEQTLRILPPPAGLLTNTVRLEAVATGEAISKVSFELDGKPVLTKGRPPYSVELNLGPAPRLHFVRALGLNGAGERIAEDEVPLNAGPHRFSVRLVEPQPGKSYKESLRAQALVDVPQDEKLERVEFYLNETLVATLFQAPYTQPILLPPGRAVTYVRALAYLADGNSTEDLVVVNSPGYSGRVDVQFVELFTSVVDRGGKPVDDLVQGDFKVVEDGSEQQIRRFEKMRDVPIYAGIMLDTSTSMGDNDKLEAAIKGALGFFQKVIRPKDRAAVVTFSDQPNLAVRFTNQEALLTGGLTGLQAAGNTTLYDSLVYTLFYFGGIKGKRAIVLLTDGKDEGSRYTYEDALEYARRSGVAIYTVGIGINTGQPDVRLKMSRLADETGGRAFFVDRASEIERIYNQIEAELRSQYLLAYQSNNEGKSDKFRVVEVKMARPGLEAKTLRGYYP
jgi:VWFA-related protein